MNSALNLLDPGTNITVAMELTSIMDALEVAPLLSMELLGNPASVALVAATTITSLYIYFVCPRLLVQVYYR